MKMAPAPTRTSQCTNTSKRTVKDIEAGAPATHSTSWNKPAGRMRQSPADSVAMRPRARGGSGSRSPWTSSSEPSTQNASASPESRTSSGSLPRATASSTSARELRKKRFVPTAWRTSACTLSECRGVRVPPAPAHSEALVSLRAPCPAAAASSAPRTSSRSRAASFTSPRICQACVPATSHCHSAIEGFTAAWLARWRVRENAFCCSLVAGNIDSVLAVLISASRPSHPCHASDRAPRTTPPDLLRTTANEGVLHNWRITSRLRMSHRWASLHHVEWLTASW
mmetsp:Transcript_108714/g.318052  ORF Transcript_108714/g.318052 Transcript_108714/m.318052 type:complete len:283 (+) Transcript_108714:160-1008(+)